MEMTPAPVSSVTEIVPDAATLTPLRGLSAGRTSSKVWAMPAAVMGQGGMAKFTSWLTTGTVVVQLLPQAAQLKLHDRKVSIFMSTAKVEPSLRSWPRAASMLPETSEPHAKEQSLEP